MTLKLPAEHFRIELERLTGAFRKNLSHFKTGTYDESALRNDYLIPFWRALGWDVENVSGATQPLREVQIESRVDIAGKKKRADYLFRTDGIERFVCEAKKPREGLTEKDAYQAQRYAFNLKLLIAALTNFETLKLFVVGGKPDQAAPWDVCKQWQYSEFVDKSQELWDLFARENVATGSLDRFVASLPKKTIKDIFLRNRYATNRGIYSAFSLRYNTFQIALAYFRRQIVGTYSPDDSLHLNRTQEQFHRIASGFALRVPLYL